MSNELVVFRLDGNNISANAQAIELRESAIAAGALIGSVTDEESNAQATDAMRRIKQVLSLCESSRKKVKEPVLDLARRIDDSAKEFSKELQEEFNRLQRVTADYQTEQLAKQRDIERKRREDEERIARERQAELDRIEKKRQEDEAEAKRKADEEAANAKSEDERRAIEEKAKADLEAINKKAEQDAKVQEGLKAVEMGALPEAPVTRATGQVVRPTYKWEVKDIWALVRAHPALVKVEPRPQEIREVINAQVAGGGKPAIAGLRIWEDVDVTVRAGRKPTTIDV